MKKDLRIIIDCAVYILNKVAEIDEFRESWGDKFCLQELDEAYQKVQVKLKEVDFNTLKKSDLKLARFGHWDGDIWLCPLYLRKLLKPNADNDVRMGCISDGWRMIDGKIDFSKEADIFSNEK
jgi:hypothetical protein